ncbi:MAG: sugar porter family MFS transporter [Endomicrobium sp.]|nr:sugar porter family MFS transporter [Endomicrobium sp.]
MKTKKIPVWLVYVVGAFGGFLFGYDLGIIAGAQPFYSVELNMSAIQEGFMVTFFSLGAMLGAFFMGGLSDKLGRKKMLMAASIIFAIGAIGCGLACNICVLLVFRAFLGLAVGGASALVPMYLSELSPAHARGKLSGLNQLMIVTGMFIAYLTNFVLADAEYGWRLMLAGAIIPASLLLVGSLIMPESPRFLVRIGRKEQAKENLSIMRDTEQEVNAEIEEIQKTNQVPRGTIAQCFTGFALPAIVAGCFLTLFQQLTGANSIFYFAPKLFMSALHIPEKDAILGNVIVGGAFLLATAIALPLIDRFNRKSLFLTGGIGMAICLFAMAYSFHLSSQTMTTSIAGTLSIIFTCGFVSFYAYSWAMTVWIVVGEMFPLHIRGVGVGIAGLVNWLGNIIVGQSFPMLLDSIGAPVCFIGFGVMCVFMAFASQKILYETKGKTLEQIENYLHQQNNRKSF